MATKVTVVSNSQSMGLGGGDYLWGTRTEAGAHLSTQGFTYAIQKHGGGTEHSMISGCGSDQGRRHPSSASHLLVQKKTSPVTGRTSPTPADLLTPQALTPSPLDVSLQEVVVPGWQHVTWFSFHFVYTSLSMAKGTSFPGWTSYNFVFCFSSEGFK